MLCTHRLAVGYITGIKILAKGLNPYMYRWIYNQNMLVGSACGYIYDPIQYIRVVTIQLTLQGAHYMVCNRSWHLPGNPKLVWHPARLTTEGGCVNLFIDTLHLKYPSVLFGSEGSALIHLEYLCFVIVLQQ